jgi:hypothetical protein
MSDSKAAKVSKYDSDHEEEDLWCHAVSDIKQKIVVSGRSAMHRRACAAVAAARLINNIAITPACPFWARRGLLGSWCLFEA